MHEKEATKDVVKSKGKWDSAGSIMFPITHLIHIFKDAKVHRQQEPKNIVASGSSSGNENVLNLDNDLVFVSTHYFLRI